MKLLVLSSIFFLSFSSLANESFMDVWKKKNIAYRVRPGESIRSILKQFGHIRREDNEADKHAKEMQVVWRNGLYSKNVKEGDILWLTPSESKKKSPLRKKRRRRIAKEITSLGPVLKPSINYTDFLIQNSEAFIVPVGDSLLSISLTGGSFIGEIEVYQTGDMLMVDPTQSKGPARAIASEPEE